MTNEEKRAFFQTFGFLLERRLFGPEEMAAISHEFDERLSRERQGQPFAGQSRQSLYGIAEQSPSFTRLVEDDRIYKTVENLLGPGFAWLCSEGNLYVGDTHWHPDGTRLDYPPMKVSLYLDPLTRDTGCLRVLPGSHLLPYHQQLKPVAKLGVAGQDLPALPCETQPGDVLFANMNLWHAAFGGPPGRRHLALNFAPPPTTAADLARLRENHAGTLSLVGKLQHSQPGRLFTDAFLHHHSPRLRSLCAPWVEMGLK